MQVQKQIIHKVSKNEFLDRLRQLASNNALKIIFNGDSFLPVNYYASNIYLLHDYGSRGLLYLCDYSELGMYICDKAIRNAELNYKLARMSGKKLILTMPDDIITAEELFNNLPDNVKIEFNTGRFLWRLEKCTEECLHENLDNLRNKYGLPELTVGQVRKMIDCVKKGLCRW